MEWGNGERGGGRGGEKERERGERREERDKEGFKGGRGVRGKELGCEIGRENVHAVFKDSVRTKGKRGKKKKKEKEKGEGRHPPLVNKYRKIGNFYT